MRAPNSNTNTSAGLSNWRFNEPDSRQRQFDAVDPDNRLVASELESRWNAALVQVAETEVRLHAEQQSKLPMDESQRNRLLALGADLQALWCDPAAPVELMKRILRTVINEIVVDVNHQSGYIEMQVHWAGGVHTPLRVRKNQSGANGNATDKNVIELVSELAKGWDDAYIASMLNRLGLHTGKENSWNEMRVKNLRRYNEIPMFSKSKERPWRTMTEAASELGVSVSTVRSMLRNRILPGRQLANGAPWIIERSDLHLPEVENYAKVARAGKRAPHEDNNQTLMLSL